MGMKEGLGYTGLGVQTRILAVMLLCLSASRTQTDSSQNALRLCSSFFTNGSEKQHSDYLRVILLSFLVGLRAQGLGIGFCSPIL